MKIGLLDCFFSLVMGPLLSAGGLLVVGCSRGGSALACDVHASDVCQHETCMDNACARRCTARVHACIRTCARTHAHTRTYTHARKYAHTHARIGTHRHAHKRMHTCMYTHTPPQAGCCVFLFSRLLRFSGFLEETLNRTSLTVLEDPSTVEPVRLVMRGESTAHSPPCRWWRPPSPAPPPHPSPSRPTSTTPIPPTHPSLTPTRLPINPTPHTHPSPLLTCFLAGGCALHLQPRLQIPHHRGPRVQ